MDLPSFLWLWKIAAWSMGLSVFAYSLLAFSGISMFYKRTHKTPRPKWLRPFHYISGIILVGLVLLLLTIGIVGTIGHYGNLGHSIHLLAGLIVVGLVLLSAVSSTTINQWKQGRTLHIATNISLLLALMFVSLTGLSVVQKYLP